MSQQTNNFDNQIRKVLYDSEETPPAYMWDRIEKELPNNKKRLPFMPIFLTATLVATFIGGTFLLTQNLNNKPIANQKQILSNNNSTSNKKNTSTKDNTDIQNTESNYTGLNESNKVDVNNGKIAVNNISNNTDNSSENNISSENNNDENEKGVGLAPYFKKKKSVSNKKEETQNSNTEQPKFVDDEAISNKKVDKKSIINTESIQLQNSKNNTTENKITTNESNVLPTKDALLSETQQEIENLLDTKTPKIVNEMSEASIDEIEASTLKKISNLKQFSGYNVKRGFHVGPFIAITNNTLTRQTSFPESNKSDLKKQLNFGKMYGLSMGYDFADRWGVLTEFAMSEQGQKYTDNQGQKYEMKLNYLKVPVLMKYKLTFLSDYNSKPIIFNFLFGGHYSWLQKCEMYTNGKLGTFDQKYNKHEWGLATGAEFDIYLNKNFYFTSGLRTGFGATTNGFPKFKGKDGTDPLSFQIGVYTKFNFRIPLKIK